MTKPKFTIRTLLWIMIVVAVFFAGREMVRRPMKRELDAARNELEARTEELMASQADLEAKSARIVAIETELRFLRESKSD